MKKVLSHIGLGVVLAIVVGALIGQQYIFTKKIRPLTFTPSNESSDAPVLIGAGDIASCDGLYDEETARLLDTIQGTIFAVGDNTYPNGSVQDYANCYEPSWGRLKERTHPAPGNHDYGTANATGYFAYFGDKAGEQGKGYYSYDLGTWHIVVLNSNCSAVGGCSAESSQGQWLRADLAAHPTECTLAYWHHPRFSSGLHGNTNEVQPLWQALYDAGADVVISGHDHTYERFAPQDASGNRDDARGIREFVVGTGGRSLYQFLRTAPNSEIKQNKTYGVLKLVLSPGRYQWEFIRAAGEAFTDSGTDICHD